ncbi:MAG: hypothetical protein P4M10_06255 [Verrucomicrobiae bacterium]|nr:hypothetical protein [Verrucomicrobiae bacterium]
MNDEPKQRMPRDEGGAFSFPPESGGIKQLVGLDGFMEIYTVRATYRVKTPNHLDPSRTIPNMPWSRSEHGKAGASNPIIARIFLQSVEALGNWSLRNGNAETVKRHLHACKEDALICEAAFRKLSPAYDSAVARINERKLNVQGNMVECPSTPNLQDESAAFLTSAKRALQSIGDVFNQFYAPDGKKPMVSNANFSFAITRLEESSPRNEEFIGYLKKVEPVTKRFADLRNGLEHRNEKACTLIEDFQLTPKGIAPPSWRRNGLADAGPIFAEMEFFLQFVIEFCENIFFHGLRDNIAPGFQIRFQVEEIPDGKIDAECPIRYRLVPLLV